MGMIFSSSRDAATTVEHCQYIGYEGALIVVFGMLIGIITGPSRRLRAVRAGYSFSSTRLGYFKVSEDKIIQSIGFNNFEYKDSEDKIIQSIIKKHQSLEV